MFKVQETPNDPRRPTRGAFMRRSGVGAGALVIAPPLRCQLRGADVRVEACGPATRVAPLDLDGLVGGKFDVFRDPPLVASKWW